MKLLATIKTIEKEAKSYQDTVGHYKKRTKTVGHTIKTGRKKIDFLPAITVSLSLTCIQAWAEIVQYGGMDKRRRKSRRLC
jgi:hypothetical protein